MRPQPIQYIKLTESMEFRTYTGRIETLLSGSKGAILTRENILTIWNITPKQVKRLQEDLEDAEKIGFILALVSGRPCTLRGKEYTHIDEPKEGMLPVPWEIF